MSHCTTINYTIYVKRKQTTSTFSHSNYFIFTSNKLNQWISGQRSTVRHR